MFQLGKGEFGHNGEMIPNTVVAEGIEKVLRNLFRAEAVLPVNFFLGLTGAALDYDSVLTDAEALEPVGNGYARQQLTRNTTDWTVEQVNGIWRARSKSVTFTASANWDKTYSRMFIASVVSGAGLLYAVSGATAAPIQVLSGAAPTVDYRFNSPGN